MTDNQKAVIGALALVGSAILFGLGMREAKAQTVEQQEVKPYVFAELPHGRIYKTVHEGCELFIVETESHGTMSGGSFATFEGHTYAIATGRGCK